MVQTNLWVFCNLGIRSISFIMRTAVFEIAVTVITSSRLLDAWWSHGFYVVFPGEQGLNLNEQGCVCGNE